MEFVLPVLAKSAFLFLMALIVACIEIESEGYHGWAENMPTWYRTRGILAKIYGMIMSGKPLTGYHSFMFFLPILIFHVQFFLGAPWSWRAELMSWAIFYAWAPLWDYLWFVLNPYYTARNFKKENVWWHKKSVWVFGLFPIDYLFGWGASFLIAFFAAEGNGYLAHLLMLIFFILFTTITIALAPIYHRWYRYMRKWDDRLGAGITHQLPRKRDLDVPRTTWVVH
jgi:hypothetical protein